MKPVELFQTGNFDVTSTSVWEGSVNKDKLNENWARVSTASQQG